MSLLYENVKGWIRKEAQESGTYAEFIDLVYDVVFDLQGELDDGEVDELTGEAKKS